MTQVKLDTSTLKLKKNIFSYIYKQLSDIHLILMLDNEYYIKINKEY